MSSEHTSRLALRPLEDADRQTIARWPHYPAPYEALDYSLRPTVGWLDIYGRKPGCLRFAVWDDEALVGFTLLVPDGASVAEFYVAIHPTYLDRHIGTAATRLTLDAAFGEHHFALVFLRVRTNHVTGIHIYEKLGFQRTDRMVEATNGVPVEFFRMELTRDAWERKKARS